MTGLLLVVDSPGGGVTGGASARSRQALCRRQTRRRFHGRCGRLCRLHAVRARPAYRGLALYADRFDRRSFQRPDVSVGLGRLGIGMDAITSGAMKDQTDPTSALTPEGRQMLQGLVNDLFGQFVSMVAEGRHLSEEKVRSLADGRAYTGRQAIALGLVDELGDEDAARLWLRKQLKIGNASYPVVPLIPEHSRYWYQWPGKRRF